MYLVLKVGLTVSASIPVAVLSITLFRAFSQAHRLPPGDHPREQHRADDRLGRRVDRLRRRRHHAGPVPARVRDGRDPGDDVGVLGGLLGILMMIPLRRAFIVKQHGKLKYPEGTACADVLIVGEKGGATAKAVFTGFGIGVRVRQFLHEGVQALEGHARRAAVLADRPGQGLNKGVLGGELDPALLGVGYIIGPRIASIMVAGGVLAYLVFVPAIAYFGEGLTQPLAPAVSAVDKDGVDPG